LEALTTRLETGSQLVVHVSGEIDIATAEQLQSSLDDALKRNGPVVVDMSGVTFIDGSGLKALLRVAASLNGRGPLALVNAPLVARLLELTGLTDMSGIEVRESE
jgi:anti-sigma B factor antagonist